MIDNQPKPNIRLNVARDFGSVFNASIRFIKMNNKSFFGSIIVLAGPLFLISGTMQAFFNQEYLATFSILRNDPFDIFNVYYFLNIFVALLAGSVLISTVGHFFALHAEKSEYEKVSLQEVVQRFFKNIPNFLGTVGYLLLFFILFATLVLIVAVMFASGGIGLAVLLIFLLVIAALLVYPNVIFFINSIFLVRQAYRLKPGAALTKIRKYMAGSYWLTWALLFVANLGVSFASAIFSLPATLLTLIQTFTRMSHYNEEGYAEDDISSVFLIVFTIIAAVGGGILKSVFVAISNMHYYSLEEKAEGKGIKAMIEEIK